VTRLIVLAVMVSGCKPAVDPAYAAEIDAWHRDRIERLTAPDGWLSLAGLHWLAAGGNPIGSGKENAVRLPASAAERVGVLHLEAGAVALSVAPGVELRVGDERFTGGVLSSDLNGAPTVVTHGRLLFFVIARGDRLGVRVKDLDSEVRTGFRGVPRYPIVPSWRIEASFEEYPTPRELEITTAVGTTERAPCPGVVRFEREGRVHRLEPAHYPGSDSLFFVFGDRTNGAETYGAGRFLDADLPVDGKVVLDFNKATNPPCAFTPYATCPLPPKQNKLALRVTAGEKRYH
jgi:uncharacterized protein (DUF1684 family)